MKTIRIRAGSVEVEAELADTAAAGTFFMAMPMSGRARRWGGRLYFRVPLELEPEGLSETVEEGAVAFWPREQAVCVFFGGRPAEAVLPLGRIKGDAAALIDVAHDEEVRLERAE